MSSVSEEQQKQQLQQLLFQQQMQHYSYDDTSSSSSPSSYYAAYYNQQQNPNYAPPYFANAYQPQHHNAHHGPQIGDQGNAEGMTWTALGHSDPGPAQFGGPVVAQPTNLGVGTRGGRSHRGRGSGNFGNRPPGTGVTGPPFRGRGRGRGRASFSHISGKGRSSSSTTNPSTDEVAKPTAEADNQKEQKPKTTVPNKPPGQTFRCELCRVDCTALDLLEQHRNGKKHKKNLERAGQLQPVAISTEPVCEKTLVQIPPAESVGLENSSSVKPAGAENQSGVQKRGTKRKMRGGRNGKSTRRANEPPKVVIPIICQLCNVKCDTQEVYEHHLAGKKHMSKLKRYEGHQSMYGPLGLQALYPPMSQTLVNPQGPQQAYPGPQGSVPQSEPYMPPQAHYSAEPLATGFDSGFPHNVGYTVPGPTSR